MEIEVKRNLVPRDINMLNIQSFKQEEQSEAVDTIGNIKALR